MRLTALLACLFLLAGVGVLSLTYLLVRQTLDRQKVSGETVAMVTQMNPGQRQTPAQMADILDAEQARMRVETLNSLLMWGSVSLVAVCVVAAGFGWVLTGRALRPIDRITETAQRITRGGGGGGRGLHERICMDGPPDEVKRLADTFDLMLEQLDGAFDGQRRFVANASHELRTPLQINQTLIELAVSRPDATADVRSLGESLLEVNARHERLTDGLLTLADSESKPIDPRPVDLAAVAAHVVDETTAVAGRDGVSIRPSRLGVARTAGDPYLIERLVQNLLDNAVKHNAPDSGWLSVRTWCTDRRACLEVINSGPVVSPYEVESLFEPFRRMRNSRRRGFGLGLSIVRAVARAHDGDVRAEARAEGGLVVTVTLPAR